MDEEEKKLNNGSDIQGDGASTAAGAAEPENTDDIFSSLLNAEQIEADFDKINFEIFAAIQLQIFSLFSS